MDSVHLRGYTGSTECPPSFARCLIFPRNLKGSLRSYDDCCNENDTLKWKCFTIIPCLSRYRKQAKCTFVCLARMVFM